MCTYVPFYFAVFPALVNIVVVSTNVKEQDVGAACFLVATVVIFLTLLFIFWMFKTPFFQFYNSAEVNNDQLQIPKMIDVIKKCWVYALSVLITFTITLSVFPSVAVLVQSETYDSGSDWATKYFTAVSVFLLFNCGDFCGRYFATWIKLPGRTNLGQIIIIVLSVARCAFVPLFLKCNIPSSKYPDKNILFKSDADFITFMALFSVSNGMFIWRYIRLVSSFT